MNIDELTIGQAVLRAMDSAMRQWFLIIANGQRIGRLFATKSEIRSAMPPKNADAYVAYVAYADAADAYAAAYAASAPRVAA